MFQGPLFRTEKRRNLKLSSLEIINEVCDYFDIDIKLLATDSRKRELVKPRQYIFYLTDLYSYNTLTETGNLLGRGHATVLHGIRQIKWFIETYPKIQKEINILKFKLDAKLLTIK